MSGAHHMGQAAAGFGAGAIIFDTWNPADISTAPGVVILSNTDHRMTGSTGPTNFFRNARSVIPLSGNIYVELKYSVVATGMLLGLAPDDESINQIVYTEAGSNGYGLKSNTGIWRHNGVNIVTLNSFQSVQWLGIAIRTGDSELYIRDAGGYMNGGDPVARTNPLDISALNGKNTHLWAGAQRANDSSDINAGDSVFQFSVPTGYQAGNFI